MRQWFRIKDNVAGGSGSIVTVDPDRDMRRRESTTLIVDLRTSLSPASVLASPVQVVRGKTQILEEIFLDVCVSDLEPVSDGEVTVFEVMLS